MKKVLLYPLIFIHFFLYGKVYDGFMFFNEIELLQVRLEELYDEVDHFVLVEGTKTFSGIDKPLYFFQNAHKFKKYKDKIIHIVMDDFPAGSGHRDNWKREVYQRNGILEGLKNCSEDDIVFICDLDEIPNKHAVSEAVRNLKNKSLASVDGDIHQLVYRLCMRLFMTQLNREKIGGWSAAKVAPYWVVKKITPSNIKTLHRSRKLVKKLPEIKDAGWHLNTMGGLDKAMIKWRSDSHEENRRHLNEEHLVNHYYNVLNDLPVIPIDKTFPKYIRENLDYFRSIGWIADY